MLLRDNNDEGIMDRGDGEDDGSGSGGGDTVVEMELENDEMALPTWQNTNASVLGQHQHQPPRNGGSHHYTYPLLIYHYSYHRSIYHHLYPLSP